MVEACLSVLLCFRVSRGKQAADARGIDRDVKVVLFALLSAAKRNKQFLISTLRSIM